MILIEDIEKVLSEVLQPKAFDKWWFTVIPSYGMTPFDIYNYHGPEEVMRLVKSYLEPGFT